MSDKKRKSRDPMGPTIMPQTAACTTVLSSLELVSAVIAFLAITLRIESELPDDGNDLPELPTHWTGPFAELARVNSAFFHASTSFLWETMGSLRPFFRLLSLNKQTRLASTGITLEGWKRFAFYSSKTKTLVLKRETTNVIDPSWGCYLLTTSTRPAPLFPAVKRLFVASVDSLSLHIALSVIPRLTFLSIELHVDPATIDGTKEASAMLTAAAVESSNNLTNIRLVNPSHLPAIINAVKVFSLTSLHMRVKREICLNALQEIERLTYLERLCVDQEPDASMCTTSNNPFSNATRVDAAISPASTLMHLRHLEVRGNGITQAFVAAALATTRLVSLTLDILSDANKKHNLFIPLVITIYAKRNPKLSSLIAHSPDSFDMNPATVTQLRNIPRVVDSGEFIKALSALKKLRVLKITRVPFFTVDITSRMIAILESFEKLKHFCFTPDPVSTLETDKIIYPPVSSLMAISKLATTERGARPTRLKQVSAMLDVSNIPPFPHEYISVHTLRSLTIYTPKVGDPSNSSHARSLSRYLDRLFPFLTSVTDSWDEDDHPEEWKYWDLIDQNMRVLRATRIQALRDLESISRLKSANIAT